MSVARHILATLFLVLGLAACEEEQPSSPVSESIFPDVLNTERMACEESGGRWGSAAVKGTFVCYRDLPDANKPCANSNQCEGACLARSRTCTPYKPLYGCYEVLSGAGLAQTVCTE